MSNAVPSPPQLLPPGDLPELAARMLRTLSESQVFEPFERRQLVSIEGAWGSAGPLVVAALAAVCPAPLVVVLPRPKDVDDFAGDVASFLGENPIRFPAWESLPDEHQVTDPIFGQRLRVLRELETAPPRVVVTSIPALMQPTPARAMREHGARRLAVGDDLDLASFMNWLVERGFERVPALEAQGEFCLHGGILDVFPADWAEPLRIELFGDEIESIRTFDVETQRRLNDLKSASICVLSADEPLDVEANTSHFDDSLPESTRVLFFELNELQDEGKAYLDRLGDPRGLFSVQATLAKLQKRGGAAVSAIAAEGRPDVSLRITSLEQLAGQRSEALAQLDELLGPSDRALIACHNEAARVRLNELMLEVRPALKDRTSLCLGQLARGFRMVDAQCVVLSDHELFGRHEVRRAPRRKRLESRAIDTFLDLTEGDLIVHLSHGIGRYRGMKLVEKEHVREEHLQLEFRDAVQLFVPVSLIHLVQKYVGGAKSSPELSKVGSNVWGKKKQKATEAVGDLAAEMLQLQAARDGRAGIAFPPDSRMMQEFEREFPYVETDDQLRAITESKRDMERPRPMDRLICGDVGYGKTEVAMRAVFKCLDAGKQAAVLVPTTVLCEQHYRSFCDRMAEFPVTIASLNRFRSRQEQREILESLEQGRIDVVIGTHRIVSKDVRFKDLGLLVVDEEQRFGVEAKEMLKRLRLEVDVLTLSATPIPRTLHLSLLGIRDISNLETPPMDRVAVETRIARFDDHLVRQAMVRELNRGGQAYFVHNRVFDIEQIADRLRRICPEATVDVVHGQMNEDDMERAMIGFVRGATQILVATTIIESGLDIPNANTMFIHQPEIYGLADLHQLRGRVGRYKHRAYCYLLLDPGKSLSGDASKRLKAIEEYSELGAGFKIAMRDLEIRGAGNLLGTEQSGHIAAIGYELYCHLLENAARALRGEPLNEHRHVQVDLPLAAFLPDDYVPPGRLKIEMYRKLSLAKTFDDLEVIGAELRDRFGPLPPEVERLVAIRDLQLRALTWHVDEIRLEGDYAVLGYRMPRKIRRLSDRSPQPIRIVDDRYAYLVLPPEVLRSGDVLPLLKSVLQPP